MLVRLADDDDAKGNQASFCFSSFKIFCQKLVFLKPAVLADVGFIVVLELESFWIAFQLANKQLEHGGLIQSTDVIIKNRTEHRCILKEVFKKIRLVKIRRRLGEFLSTQGTVEAYFFVLLFSKALPGRREIQIFSKLCCLVKESRWLI